MFSAEVRAYERLSPLQGHAIPIMYGHYHLEFPERELRRDSIVYVTLLEYIPGPCLRDVSISKMTKDETQLLWKKISKSIKSLHDEGVIQKFPALRKIIWRNKDTEEDEIVFTDFSWAITLEDKDRETSTLPRLELTILHGYVKGAIKGRMYE